MLKLGFEPEKIFIFSKNTLLPLAVMGLFFIYFFSVSEFSDETYHTIHILFISVSAVGLILSTLLGVAGSAMAVSVIYIGWLVINGMRYTYGEDYMFSAGYNIWSILFLPDLLLAHMIFQKNRPYRQWSWFYVFLFAETAIIEKLQKTDAYFFYKHIGMLNYPALCISVLCLIILFVCLISKGRIISAASFFSSVAVFTGIYLSDNLFAFSLFFGAAVTIELCSALYYAYYILYRDEELDIPNCRAYYKDAEKKYPLKYSIALMYMDEYERLLKRFGAGKVLTLKKMFLTRIRKVDPEVFVYNYRPDALILSFMNANAAESFEKAENIRRILAKSIFIFNENNHLQLTVSQCVSEKKRSDADAAAVLVRAEENLQKACKFTHNITIKA